MLSIIIPVHNNYNFTKSCINDLKKLPQNHEIIIINNASTDKTNELLNNLDNNRIKIVTNNENLGFAKASNQGYRISTKNNVLFLNNDIRVKNNHSNWTNELIEAAEAGYIAGPTIGELDDNFNFIAERNEVGNADNIYISGWCLAASKETLDKIDLGNGNIFDENFFAYFEDTDLSFRAKEKNIPFKLVNVPVIHFGRMTGKKLNISSLYLQSRKKFLNKWVK